jgi:hypothetical protein
MLTAGVLNAGTQIVLTYRGKDHWATIDEDGGIVLKATGGTPYDKVDDAGAAVRGTRTCQGSFTDRARPNCSPTPPPGSRIG